MSMTGTNRLPRRSFITTMAVGGVGATLAAAGSARAQAGGKLTPGDVAILRFLAAAEILEADLWQQYAELANNNPAYNNALLNIDPNMVAYIQQNSNDEFSHQAFLNQFLISQNLQPVDLTAFLEPFSSQATGAEQIGRLTNLMHLNVDTSWYTRYRGAGNPDFGDTFPQVASIVNRPGIPLHDNYTANQIQAIANTAALHFGTIEQGGTSLYPELSLKVTSLEVLRIVTNIGPAEAWHLALWDDLAGEIPAVDSGDGLVFPEVPARNTIFPTPCTFDSPNLPRCAVVRPTSDALISPMAVVNFLTQDGLFVGQSPGFFKALTGLAAAAQAAKRQIC
jgi:Ferritin-like domain